MNTPQQIINRYFVAQMFLTRLPVPGRLQWSEPELAASTAYFPLVGVLVGLSAGLAATLGALIWSAEIGALLAVASGILITGAFHEDGLADSADGLGGAFEIAKKLTIMRDSRIGTYGSAALFLVTLGKIAALSLLAGKAVIAALVIAHTLARWSSLPLIANNDYVRESGSGKPFAPMVTRVELITGSCIAVTVIMLCLLLSSLSLVSIVLAVVASITLIASAQWYLRRQLGGITGDTLGAVNSLTELTVYLVLSAAMFT